MNESGPVVLVFGVYVTVLSALTFVEPLEGADVIDTVSGSPSGSLSFVNTLTITALSCLVETKSSLAVGLVFGWVNVTSEIVTGVATFPAKSFPSNLNS